REAFDEAGPDGIEHLSKHDRYRASLLLHDRQGRQATIHDDLGSERYQLGRVAAHVGGIAAGPPDVEFDIAALRPAKVLQPLAERCHARLSLRVLLRQIHEYGDPAEAIAWLRSCRRKRPSGRAAKQGDDLAPPYHSITSSATASNVGGTSR